MLAKATARRQSLKAGWFGAATGLCAFIPGFGILMGFFFWWLVESRVMNRLTKQLCEGLVDAYLPDADEADEIAQLLAHRRDPNRIGRIAGVVDAAVARVMNPMRDLETMALLRIFELLSKLLLPFGLGALLGFAVNYWEMNRRGRWVQDRLEAFSGVPESHREPYTDRSGWCGCALVVLALALTALAVGIVTLIIRLF